MKRKHIIIAAWVILVLSVLPELTAVLRFRWDGSTPVSRLLALVIQHRAACIPFVQWFLMATLVLGWMVWHQYRSKAGWKLLLAAGLPILLSLFVNLYEIRTWYFVTRYNLGPQERVNPASFLRPLGEDPNNTSEGIRQPADGLTKPSM